MLKFLIFKINTMMALHKWTMLGCIIVLCGQLTAQKPTVQVSFQLVKGTPFYQKYSIDTAQIKQDGLIILKDSLNQYLPFIEFTTAPAPYKLNVKLDQKIAEGSDVIKEYYFFLTFTGPSAQPTTDQWKFLTPSQFISLKPGASNALAALKLSWSEYLKMNYDLVLVHNMFHQIPIQLSSADNYYASGTRYELILPYSKKDIKLFPMGTEFTVVIKGMSGPTPTEQTQGPVRYAGDVDLSMNKPAMKGCIRIGLNQVTVSPFTSGDVYFIKYARDFSAATTTPGSFIDNNQTP
jgi:hypothetical protein